MVSLNAQRRDLTAGQRAIVAAKTWLAGGDTGDKGKGRRAKGDELQSVTHSVKALARQFRTSNPSVIQARDLLTEAPDLAGRVSGCSLSLAAAYEELQARRRLLAAGKARDATSARRPSTASRQRPAPGSISRPSPAPP